MIRVGVRFESASQYEDLCAIPKKRISLAVCDESEGTAPLLLMAVALLHDAPAMEQLSYMNVWELLVILSLLFSPYNNINMSNISDIVEILRISKYLLKHYPVIGDIFIALFVLAAITLL